MELSLLFSLPFSRRCAPINSFSVVSNPLLPHSFQFLHVNPGGHGRHSFFSGSILNPRSSDHISPPSLAHLLSFLCKMQISASLLALLAIPAARALPVNNAQVAAVGGSNLAARGGSQSELLARHLTPQAQGAAKSVQSIYARFAHIQNDGERSVAVVRDLQRRGIIDTLVQAIAAILTELLGTDGAPARHYRRQLTVLGMQTGSIVDDITCLLLKLFGINDSNCAGKPAKRDVSSASNSFAGLNAADPVAMRESLGDLLSHIGRALEKEEFDGGKALFQRAVGDDTELLARQFPATLGVEGLLTVLRQLLDAVLNTLLPLSPRQENASATTSAARATGTNCPPPGTPNDGMYRPGCPGYGRRELDLSARDADSEQLQNTASLLQMLIQQLEPLVQKANDAAGDASDASATATSDDAAATASAASGDASASSSDGSESSAVEGALAQLTSSASTPGPSASSSDADGAESSSEATPTVAARDFLEADGFQYVRRQTDAAASATDDTSATSTASSASPSSTSGSSASYSMVKGLVSELFSMFSGGGSGGSSASKTTTEDASDSSSASSGSSNAFMSLISNVLGGLSSRSVAEGPLKRRVVDGLLERALGGSPMVRSMASLYVDRAVDHVNEIIKARADFEPVWTEIKKLGNSHFGLRSVEMQQRDADEGSLHDVWSNFSQMIDASIAEDKKQAANGGAKRSPSPSVDVKPFADAATKWAQKNLAKDGAKAKRDFDQFQPLAQAAGSFAKQQMKEWTAALNKHNGVQKS